MIGWLASNRVLKLPPSMFKQEATPSELRRREMFLGKLLTFASAATDETPTVRCWSELSLKRALLTVRRRMDSPPRTSGDGLLRYLEEVCLVQTIPTQKPPGKAKSPVFYLLDVEAGGTAPSVDPLELLQAHHPAGVVCYFSALAIHDLTTQPPSSHHLAIPQSKRGSSTQPTRTLKPRVASAGAPRSGPNPLGTPVFLYGGLTYFISRRTFPLAHVQSRYVNSRTIVRYTTLEQTLLDTLHKPQRCGGPEVIFEAWERAVELLDERRLLDCLESTGSRPSQRRLAAMLATLDYRIRLPRLAEKLAPGVEPDDQEIPLLPGVASTRVDPRWAVQVP